MSLYSVNDEVGFPGGSVVEPPCQGRRRGLDPWVGKFDPLEKERHSQTPCIKASIRFLK